MVFFDWLLIGRVAICIAVIGAICALIWFVRRKRLAIRIPVIAVGAPISLIGILFLSLVVLTELMGCETHSAPIYSPTHKIALRVEDWDAGATGGGSEVRIYQEHGFRVDTVVFGGWKFVQAEDIEWLDDSHLLIRYEHYDGYDEGRYCHGTRDVQVQCVPK